MNRFMFSAVLAGALLLAATGVAAQAATFEERFGATTTTETIAKSEPARIGGKLKINDIGSGFDPDHNEHTIIVVVDAGEGESAVAVRALINFVQYLNRVPEVLQALSFSADLRCLEKEMLGRCEFALVPKVESTGTAGAEKK